MAATIRFSLLAPAAAVVVAVNDADADDKEGEGVLRAPDRLGDVCTTINEDISKST